MNKPQSANPEAQLRSAEPPLAGHQIQALQKDMAATRQAILKDVELRKWAIDQACGLAGAQVEAEMDVIADPVKLAREIHGFLTEGAGEGK